MSMSVVLSVRVVYELRVARHFRKSKRHHWHIDYLVGRHRPGMRLVQFLADSPEHEWARALSQIAGVSGIEGFGCSDCRCNAHLFAYSRKAMDAEILHAIGGAVELWPYRVFHNQNVSLRMGQSDLFKLDIKINLK
ncbi:MAG: DUF123 domain-containing protein [Candidatus Competibacteraceae bacterium]